MAADSYRGVHSSNTNTRPIDSGDNNEDGGYSLDIFLNKENATDYICAMYAALVIF